VRKLPDIWEVGGRKRVLRSDLSAKDKALLLLESCEEMGALEEDLFDWCRYSGRSMFRVRVVEPLDEETLIDLGDQTKWITLSPTGAQHVEKVIQSKPPVGA
jgi:hypothetical protein